MTRYISPHESAVIPDSPGKSAVNSVLTPQSQWTLPRSPPKHPWVELVSKLKFNQSPKSDPMAMATHQISEMDVKAELMKTHILEPSRSTPAQRVSEKKQSKKKSERGAKMTRPRTSKSASELQAPHRTPSHGSDQENHFREEREMWAETRNTVLSAVTGQPKKKSEPSSPNGASVVSFHVSDEEPKTPAPTSTISKKGKKNKSKFGWLRKTPRSTKANDREVLLPSESNISRKSIGSRRSVGSRKSIGSRKSFGSKASKNSSKKSERDQPVQEEYTTSPLQVLLWVSTLNRAIAEARDASPTHLENEKDANAEDPTYFQQTMDAGVVVDYSTFDDGESISSIELLLKWLTCRDLDDRMRGKRKPKIDPRGMVIATDSASMQTISWDDATKPKRRTLYSR